MTVFWRSKSDTTFTHAGFQHLVCRYGDCKFLTVWPLISIAVVQDQRKLLIILSEPHSNVMHELLKVIETRHAPTCTIVPSKHIAHLIPDVWRNVAVVGGALDSGPICSPSQVKDE